MQPRQVQRLRKAWLAALVCVTGCAMFASGVPAAALTALAFVGTTVLAVVAFILNVLLAEEPLVLRVLLIVLFLGLLAVEINGLVRVIGLIG